jgi:hypothetical protein
MRKWVAFISKDYPENELLVTTIIASADSIEECNESPAALEAWANGENVIYEFIAPPIVTTFP